MNNLYNSIQQFGNKLFLFGLLLMAFLLPIHKMSTSIALLLMSLGFVLGTKSISNKPKISWMVLGSIIAYAVLHLLSYFQSEYLTYAQDDLIKKLPLILIPTFLFFHGEFKKENLRQILSVFAWTAVLMSTLLISLASYSFIVDGHLLFSEDLLRFTILHPSYLSMYLLVAIAIFLFEKSNIALGDKIFVRISTIVILSLCVLLLSSRTAILTGAVLLTVHLFTQFSKVKALFITLTAVSILAGTIWQTPYLKERFTRGVNLINMAEADPNSYDIDERALTWQNAFELIQERPIQGYSIGDYCYHYLKEKHNESGFGKGYKERLNAHNQFLESWLALGILGLISILALYTVNLYVSMRHTIRYISAFIFISLAFSMSESIFQSQGGNMFFGFFIGLLLLQLNNTESNVE